ncbi:xylogen-like protein 11 [Brachypodium distachyon]|uniref:Bifunctional inhibitor/plant lipid transfer protein/seed storage helical domain-containing protein n=1 Tax=Brachypodium distachyon TaxID=15368 RepID=A0A2K2DT90_BRADI|nr:xylogen-like protein 11 [Brachypodium distachyon]PNT77494.1 hypothetical protein BRADI_1g63791v3 [Brachypodium distachyon]PNT77495.1 hypothetical protein BRADI_1g63791v3 [Brachypodium distachyon]PNT77496.1 hypothetical protein BRADI_1g63791v3 [Brachypodium distachyon]|eukprot:XP_024312768.1 xylogen-like protein 11 [Brachypodium distachyon]
MMPPVAAVLALALLAAVSPLQPRATAKALAPSLSPAPAPSWGALDLDCTSALLNLSSCLTYVESGSALTRPEKGCCGALSGVVDGEAACLCGLVGGYGASGVRVDAVRALALPTICRVDAPPPRLCAALGLPVVEPPGAAGPADPGNGTPATIPATAAANGGPVTHRNRGPHLLLLVHLPYCAPLFTLLLLLLLTT